MAYIQSDDGVTPGRRVNELPTKAWVQDTVEAGHYVELTEQNMNDHGFYTFTQTARPDADHVRSVARVGAGFETVWTFDQAAADANAEAAADETERQTVRDMLPALAALSVPGAMTNAEQSQAIHQLARAVRRLIRDSI